MKYFNNNEYLIKFDNRYNKDNFNFENLLFLFLGTPLVQKIKNLCAFCYLNKNDVGVYIEDFKICDNVNGKKLKKLLDEDFKKILIYRNIIKKSDSYFLSVAFIDIIIYEKDASMVIDKRNKLNDIMIF